MASQPVRSPRRHFRVCEDRRTIAPDGLRDVRLTVGPHADAVVSLDKLRRNAHLVTRLAHRAFDEVIRTERLPHGAHVGFLALELKRRLAPEEPRDPDALDNALRLRAIQTKIGHELRAQYDVPKEFPHRILALLMQLDAEQDGKAGEATASERPPAPQSTSA